MAALPPPPLGSAASTPPHLAPPTAFADLELACIANILSRLSARQVGGTACVCRLWRDVAADDALWRPHLARDFATTECAGPDGDDAASYKAAYGAWQERYADVSGPLMARALAAWHAIRAWLGAHSPRILGTLNPGATAAEVAEAEGVLGHPLPQAMRCIYRVHNGQTLSLQQASCEEGAPRDLLHGLFGCLVFYDHVTSSQLLPLGDAVKLSRMLRTVRPLGAQHPLLTSREVCYATSFKVSEKLCVVDCDTGAVAFKMPHRDWPLTPPRDAYEGACDGLLRWFEEYARRLSSGVYGTCGSEPSLTELGLDASQAISLFPRAHPLAATAITRGVKVTWSSVMVPQESRSGRLMFAYNVHFSMLTPQQEADALAQLSGQQAAWQAHERALLQEAGSSSSSTPSATAQSEPPKGDDAAMTEAAPAGPAEAAAAAQPLQRTRNPHAGSVMPPRQAIALGPCSAAAGPGAVPLPLAVPLAWAADAAARRESGGSVATDDYTAAGTSGGGAAVPASCQLESRHWRILDAHGSVTERVDGEGVVGLYPLLYPGGEAFSYASCTGFPVPQLPPELPTATTADAAAAAAGAASAAGTSAAAAAASAAHHGAAPAAVAAAFVQQQAQQAAQQRSAVRWATGPGRLAGCVLGLMEGSFDFVGGSLMQRTGGSVDVACPRLVFAVPEYLY